MSWWFLVSKYVVYVCFLLLSAACTLLRVIIIFIIASLTYLVNVHKMLFTRKCINAFTKIVRPHHFHRRRAHFTFWRIKKKIQTFSIIHIIFTNFSTMSMQTNAVFFHEIFLYSACWYLVGAHGSSRKKNVGTSNPVIRVLCNKFIWWKTCGILRQNTIISPMQNSKMLLSQLKCV